MDSEVDYIKYRGDRSSAELSAVVLLEHLSRLPFLRKFSMIFHPNKSGWGDNADDERLEQGIGERIDLFWTTFEALEGVSSLRSLEIYNLQTIEEPDAEALAKSRPFCTVLGRLEGLRISLISSFRGIPPDVWGEADYENFPQTWLKACTNLKKLSIFLEPRFSFSGLPFSLRHVRLEHLEEIEMGNWRMTREEDLDWVLAHQSTLRKLFFVNWKIEVDEDRTSCATFNWASIYSKLRTLPKLIKFENLRRCDLEVTTPIDRMSALYRRISPELENVFKSSECYDELSDVKGLLLKYDVHADESQVPMDYVTRELGVYGDKIPNTGDDGRAYDLFLETVEKRWESESEVA